MYHHTVGEGGTEPRQVFLTPPSQTLPTLPTLPYSDIAVSLWGAKKIEAPNRQ
jgi:hypothetical protein